MCSFDLANSSILLVAQIIGIVSKHVAFLLACLILVQDDKIWVAIICDINWDELTEIEARVACVDVGNSESYGTLVQLYVQVDV